jgi:hypothetical protein
MKLELAAKSARMVQMEKALAPERLLELRADCGEPQAQLEFGESLLRFRMREGAVGKVRLAAGEGAAADARILPRIDGGAVYEAVEGVASGDE